MSCQEHAEFGRKLGSVGQLGMVGAARPSRAARWLRDPKHWRQVADDPDPTAQTGTFFAGIGNAGVRGATVEVGTATGQLGIAPLSARKSRTFSRSAWRATLKNFTLRVGGDTSN
jgi:hypothetical protein